ncbi:MAG: lactonase family protein [Candidatus Symbiothrix sp.]|jgi:6-phosphogluconolactonase (cycloisomerase 2 family)|nr:lactonase family protein [Candidatus Symbiothrix sp.]
MYSNRIVLFVFTLCLFACTSPKEKPVVNEVDSPLYLIVGSYSDGTTPGISVYNFESRTGDFEYVSDVKGVVNPSYLVVSPDEQFIYSVNETGNGAVSSFTFDKTTGTLSLINYQFTEGADPCYININKEATFIVTANYSGGNISVFPLSRKGCIEPLSQKIDFSKEGDLVPSHIHTVVFSPDGKYLYATDLGKDKIYTFIVAGKDDEARLYETVNSTVELKSGSGPRHLAFSPDEKFIYSINELAGTVAAFEYNEGIRSNIQYIASDTTPGVGEKGSADIHLTPDGRFLYASNRLKADGIAIFSVHPETGILTKTGYQETGIHPRNFLISPNGKFLLCANRDSHTVQIFTINPETGLLQFTGKEIVVDKPVCLKWIANI